MLVEKFLDVTEDTLFSWLRILDNFAPRFVIIGVISVIEVGLEFVFVGSISSSY